jgi:hypothetical protein
VTSTAPAAARVGDDPAHAHAGLQAGVAGGEGGIDAARLRVALGAERAREAVARGTADARAVRPAVDAHRVRGGPDALVAQPAGEVGDVGLVLERGIRERRAAPRRGGVLAGRAVHAVDALGLGVVGLEARVGEGPRRRRALAVLDRAEVLLAQARQARAVDLRVAADHVVHPGGERTARAVEPLLVRAVAPLAEHRARRPVRRLARQSPPALEHEDVDAPARQGERRRPATHARADHDDLRG